MVHSFVRSFARRLAPFGIGAAAISSVLLGSGGTSAAGPVLVPLAIEAPDVPATAGTSPACTSPAPVHRYGYYHCYTPQDIRAAYGVDQVAALKSGAPNMGLGQTIVLVDSYGSPTAASDLNYFHQTFFPNLPAPHFDEVYPQGAPNYSNTQSAGLSGPSAAANWSGEA